MATATSTTAYLDPPNLIGRQNADGTISLTPLELKKLNDYNYYVAKIIQGGLNLANLNAAANKVFSDIEGNVTELTTTAQGLTLDVSNLAGDLTSLSVTVDGMRLADETGSYTIIDGDKLTSKDHSTGGIIEIKDGSIFIKNGTTILGEILPSSTLGLFIEAGTGKYIYLSGKVQIGMYDDVGINGNAITIQSENALRLISSSNTSINSSIKTYIGTNASYSGNVDIGQSGGTVNINGSTNINGKSITYDSAKGYWV